MVQKIKASDTNRILEEIKLLRREMNNRFVDIDTRLTGIDKRFTKIDGSFTAIDKGFDRVDSKFEEVDRKFKTLHSEMTQGFDEVIDKIQLAMDGVYELSKDNDRKLQENLEPRVEKLEKHVFASPV